MLQRHIKWYDIYGESVVFAECFVVLTLLL